MTGFADGGAWIFIKCQSQFQIEIFQQSGALIPTPTIFSIWNYPETFYEIGNILQMIGIW